MSPKKLIEYDLPLDETQVPLLLMPVFVLQIMQNWCEGLVWKEKLMNVVYSLMKLKPDVVNASICM